MDLAFTSFLKEAFLKHLSIRMLTVSVTDHKSLLAEHGIKSLSTLLVKYLSEVWSWSNSLPYAMLCYNSYNTPNLDGFGPYELVFGHKAILSHDLENKPNVVVSGTFKTYYEKLRRNLHYLCSRLQKFRSERNNLLNRSKEHHSIQVGHLVYMHKAKGNIIHTGSRKIACYFVGLLVIYRTIGPIQFLLMSLTGKTYPFLVEETKPKPIALWTTKGNVHTLAELKQVLSARVKISFLKNSIYVAFYTHVHGQLTWSFLATS